MKRVSARAFFLSMALILAGCGGPSTLVSGSDVPPAGVWEDFLCSQEVGCTPLFAEKAAKEYRGDGSSEHGETWCIVYKLRDERRINFSSQREGSWTNFIASTTPSPTAREAPRKAARTAAM